MAFRTIVISTHSKLEYSLNYIVFRTTEEIKRILIDEVHTVIFESTNVSVTTSLLAELISRKIKVIFCNEKHNPISELMPYNIAHNSSKRIIEQIHWLKENKDLVWKSIIKAKILNQSKFLRIIGKFDKADQLYEYSNNVLVGDVTNREGHAAKVYFNSVFYKGFTRNDDCFINKCLDYGYTILLSQFNRIVNSGGYLTQLGIHHIGEFNPFNFSSDLIEPFRFIVDVEARKLKESDDFKMVLVNLLNKYVVIDSKKQTVYNAMHIYFQSIIEALGSGDVGKIRFISEYDDD